MDLKTLAKQFAWIQKDKKKESTKYSSPHKCSSYCDCIRIQREVVNWKGKIMQDENGEIIIKEERDMTGIVLSGPNQVIETAAYLESFAAFINSENPKELLRSLFCDTPEKMYLELTPEEKLDFVHKLNRCATIIKIYSQSAEKHRRDELDSLTLEDRIELKKKDQAYKIRPIEKDREKLNVETKQEKFVNMIRSMKDKDGNRVYSEEQILTMIHGKKK